MKTEIENKKGFSLVEVLFAILVLSVGIAAVAVLMTGNIKNSITAKNQIVASELAQEGLELVRNLKDNNPTFTTDVVNGSDYSVDYKSDYTAFIASNVSTGEKELFSNGGFFSHSGSTPTKFFRKIAVSIATDLDGKKTANVTSYVTWNGTGFSAITGFPATCNIANQCVSVVSVLPDLN